MTDYWPPDPNITCALRPRECAISRAPGSSTHSQQGDISSVLYVATRITGCSHFCSASVGPFARYSSNYVVSLVSHLLASPSVHASKEGPHLKALKCSSEYLPLPQSHEVESQESCYAYMICFHGFAGSKHPNARGEERAVVLQRQVISLFGTRLPNKLTPI